MSPVSSYISHESEIFLYALADGTQSDRSTPLGLVALHRTQHGAGITDQVDDLRAEESDSDFTLPAFLDNSDESTL